MTDPNSKSQTLSELIDLAEQRHDTSSGRGLEKIARGGGHQIVHTTINAIRSGKYKSRPSDETIRAIAWLSGVPERVAFVAAGMPAPLVPFRDELPDGVDQLSPKRRRIALELLRNLVEAEQLEHSTRDDRSAQLAVAAFLQVVPQLRESLNNSSGEMSAAEFIDELAEKLAKSTKSDMDTPTARHTAVAEEWRKLLNL